jgi:hypothetical protein
MLGVFLAAAALSLPAAPFAEGCTGTTMSCNSQQTGRLTSTDCTQSGAPFDAYFFDGTAGDLVEVTIRTSNFQQPLVTLIPPAGDASKVPIISGGSGGATLSYVLGSTGRWQIAVGSSDPFASGEYLVSLTCGPDPNPSLPVGCLSQSVLCGQKVQSSLSGQSCRFTSQPDFAYEEYDIFGHAGDVVTVTMDSFFLFKPVFGIYDADTLQLLASSLPASGASSKQILSYTFPTTKEYAIITTSQDPRATGPYEMTVQCGASGCLAPLLTSTPASTHVPSGQRATLTAAANGTNVQLKWFDATDIPQIQVGTGSSFTTPPVTTTQYYTVTATNECGSVTSNLVKIEPAAPGRRRSVTH